MWVVTTCWGLAARDLPDTEIALPQVGVAEIESDVAFGR